MDIRKPTELELKKVLDLSPEAVFEGTLGEVRPTAEKIDQLVEPLLKKGSQYFIAAEGDVLMGWVFFGHSKDQFTDQSNGFIYELFVLEEYRGKGIAKKLLKAAIDQLKHNGHTEVRLSAFSSNHAIKLYEELGFTIKTVTMSLPLLKRGQE